MRRLTANAIIYYNSVIFSRLPDKYQTTKKLQSTGPSQKISPIAWQHIHFHGHYTFCVSRHPIDLDAMVANLTLQEG